jgi:Yip1-like protein
MTTPRTNTFLQRLIGAAALDAAIYEEVEADRTATGQAVLVVILSSLAAGVGSRGFGGASIGTMLLMTIGALLGWAAWALVTLQIGGRLMPEPQTRVDMGELLRTIGFANTPGLLRVFGIMPSVSYPAFAIAAVWMLLAMIIAVRQALDYTSTSRAVIVCAIGWVLSIVISVVIGLFFAPPVS